MKKEKPWWCNFSNHEQAAQYFVHSAAHNLYVTLKFFPLHIKRHQKARGHSQCLSALRYMFPSLEVRQEQQWVYVFRATWAIIFLSCSCTCHANMSWDHQLFSHNFGRKVVEGELLLLASQWVTGFCLIIYAILRGDSRKINLHSIEKRPLRSPCHGSCPDFICTGVNPTYHERNQRCFERLISKTRLWFTVPKY